MSNYIELTDADFEEKVLKSDIPFLVDMWAPWCAPCRFVAPILEEIAAAPGARPGTQGRLF